MDVVPQIFSQVIMILTGFIIVGLNIPVSYLVFILVLFIGNVAITIFAQRKVSTTRAA